MGGSGGGGRLTGSPFNKEALVQVNKRLQGAGLQAGPSGGCVGHRAIPGGWRGVRKLGIDAATPAHHWLKAAPGSVNSLVICNPVHLGEPLEEKQEETVDVDGDSEG